MLKKPTALDEAVSVSIAQKNSVYMRLFSGLFSKGAGVGSRPGEKGANNKTDGEKRNVDIDHNALVSCIYKWKWTHQETNRSRNGC